MDLHCADVTFSLCLNMEFGRLIDHLQFCQTNIQTPTRLFHTCVDAAAYQSLQLTCGASVLKQSMECFIHIFIKLLIKEIHVHS